MKQDDEHYLGPQAASFRDYAAEGTEISRQLLKLNDPAEYIVSRELRHAVEVALILGQPLLVTGEPGTGKTQLARRVAYELGLPAEIFPLTFNTKSTSTAKDLFYQYDALGHFHDAQIMRQEGQRLDVHSYITYEALGKAILLSLSPDDERRRRVNDYLPGDLRDIYGARSVVLIDEIDKAPRDMPNDVLNEIESMSFTISELTDDERKQRGLSFTANQNNNPIVIITSNSERDLPEAFLRRCVYYNIEFPDEKNLSQIINGRIGLDFLTEKLRENAVRLFFQIRGLPGLRKPPATAELLSWVRVLERQKLNVLDQKHARDLEYTYSSLAKDAADFMMIRDESARLVEIVRAENLAAEVPAVNAILNE